MRTAWFAWNGQRCTAVEPLTDRGAVGTWTIACPQCGDGIPCNGLPRDELGVGAYQIHVADDGALTLSPSVICPRCQWHVVITNGVAQ